MDDIRVQPWNRLDPEEWGRTCRRSHSGIPGIRFIRLFLVESEEVLPVTVVVSVQGVLQLLRR